MRPNLIVHTGLVMGAFILPAGAIAAPLRTLYHFTGATDGASPTGNLVAGPHGSLYGVAGTGGAYGDGTVFRLDRPVHGSGQWTVTTIYSFAGGADAATPNSLTVDAVGNLYGTSAAGGGGAACTTNGTVTGCGTVFALTPSAGGGFTETVIHAFQGPSDGQNPEGVAVDGAGDLYGFALIGGPGVCHFQGAPFNCGTAFRLTPVEGAGWSFSLIYSFKNDADGNVPFGPPAIGPHGELYGETESGGPGAPVACRPVTGCGEVFRLTPRRDGEWIKTALWVFNGPDGAAGTNPVTLDYAGNLYGMTNEGGPASPRCPGIPSANVPPGCGVAFELSPPADGSSAWTYQTIWNFTLGADSGYPFNAALTQADGRWFTTTSGPYPLVSGPGTYGAIVEFIPPNGDAGWREKSLFTFSNDAGNEAQPESTLFFLNNWLYGTALGYDTTGSFGTVFRVRP